MVTPMNEPDEMREMARRLMRAADLQGKQFVRQRFAATDLIVSSRPVEGGYFVSEPYQGQPFDPKYARIVKSGWNHEHCYICGDRVVPGEEWWAALPPDHAGLCLACCAEFISTIRDPQSGGRESPKEARHRREQERKVTLTEAEWLSSTIPRAMLMTLEDRANTREIDRKLRLFACACARRVWHLLEDERSVKAIEVAEEYADGMVDPEELDAAGYEAQYAASELYASGGLAAADEARIKYPESNKRPAGAVFGERPEERTWIAAKAAEDVTHRKVGISGTTKWYEGGAWVAALTTSMSASDAIAGVAELRAREAAHQAAVAALDAPLTASDTIAASAELRAREVAVQKTVEARRLYEEPWQSDLLRCIFGNPFRPIIIELTWISPTSLALARSIYETRSFDLLPDLADALEKAGCSDVALLDHCHKPGQHALGCWVIDAVLGKL